MSVCAVSRPRTRASRERTQESQLSYGDTPSNNQLTDLKNVDIFYTSHPRSSFCTNDMDKDLFPISRLQNGVDIGLTKLVHHRTKTRSRIRIPQLNDVVLSQFTVHFEAIQKPIRMWRKIALWASCLTYRQTTLLGPSCLMPRHLNKNCKQCCRCCHKYFNCHFLLCCLFVDRG